MAQRYPILLSPLRPARFDSGQSRPDRQRYALALRIYQRLGQQSDPWLQAVATDLSARCHAQLGEWSLALAMYDELARQFGEAVDGSGVPIDLGVAFRRAAIHQRMGASVEYVEGYLGAYEGLLGGRWSVSEAQRQRLTRYVRKTLSRYFANHGGEQRQRGRFEALRRREQQAALPGKGQKTL